MISRVLKYKWFIVVLLSVCFLFFVFKFIENKKNKNYCSEIRIILENKTQNNQFIDNKYIVKLLSEGDKNFKLLQIPINQLNLVEFENILKKDPFIEKAEVYVELNGRLNFKIKSRTPIVRIINKTNENYYIDANGLMMPIIGKYTPNVIVANGNITEKKNIGKLIENKTTHNLLSIAKKINENELYNLQFEQMYVDNYLDIELIPRVGKHIIVVGDSLGIDNKLENLFILYKEGFNKIGWDKYSKLDLRFENQIVGVKNENLINTETKTEKVKIPDTKEKKNKKNKKKK